MTLAFATTTRELPTRDEASLVEISDLADLTRIFEPDVNAVVLRRRLSRELLDECRNLASGPARRTLATIESGPAGLRTARTALPTAPELAQDIQVLAEVLGDLTESHLVGARLAVLDGPMCPRFHVDHVVLRALCTYTGPGTEIVANEQMDRRRFGHDAAATTTERSELLFDDARVHAAEPGDLVLLKGEGWPGNSGFGAVHRSPRHEAGRSRLVLTLDPL
jgi:hypothetical protein